MTFIFPAKHLESPATAIRAFAREAGLPFTLTYPAFKALSRRHAQGAAELEKTIRDRGAERWRLETVHHIFWRAELKKEK